MKDEPDFTRKQIVSVALMFTGMIAGFGTAILHYFFDLEARADWRRHDLHKLTGSVHESVESVNAATVQVEQAIEEMARETSRVQKQAIWIGASVAILGAILGAIAGAYAAQVIG